MLYRANWIKVSGVLFKKPCVLLYSIDEEQPVFGDVIDLFVFGTRPIAFVRLYRTISFLRHYHAYHIERSSTTDLIPLDSSPPTFYVRTLIHNLVIVPKFKIVGVTC